MSDLSEIETLVRYQLEDFSHTQIPGDIFTYSSSSVFTLTESNPISVSTVLVNDVEIGSSNWSFDSDSNKITISAALTTGDTVEIQYTYYPKYSSTTIQNYTRSASIYLSIHNYYTFEIGTDGNFYPDIKDKEKNLLAFIAATLIEPRNESYVLPDIRVNVPGSLSTPDLIARAISVFKRNSHGVFDLT